MTEAGWTREPKQEGYYWWRKDHELEVLQVWDCGGLQVSQMQTDEGFGSISLDSFIRQYGGEWLGPLSPTDRQQGRVAGAQDVLESFKKHHDACNDFRHCECAGGFWYEHIGKAWMDEKAAQAAQAAQDEKGVGDGNIKMS